MIWDSIFLMTVIDIAILFATIATLFVFYRHIDFIKKLDMLWGVSPILVALFVNAIFHTIDLLVMYRVPMFTGNGNWMAVMTDLHLNWSWVKDVISVVSMAIGISYLVRTIIPRTVTLLHSLRETEAALRDSNTQLEERIAARVAELQETNTKLEAEVSERERTEHALLASQSRWRSLLQNAPNILFEFDRDGTILFINFTTTDTDPESVIGKSLFEFSRPEEHERVREYIEQVFRTGESLTYETQGFDERWYSVRVGAVKEDNKIDKLMMVLADITDLKQSEIALSLSQAQLLSMANASPDVTYIVNQQAEIMDVLTSQNHLLPYPIQALYGKPIEAVVPKTFASPIRTAIEQTFATRNVQSLEYDMEVQDVHRWFDCRTAIVPALDEETERVLFVVRDITERKQAEQQLTQSTEVIALKDRIISTVSHEFRTPLALIQTSSDMLRRYKDRLDDERKEDLYKQIRKQIVSLTDMIDDMLIISRTQSMKLNFNPTEIDMEEFCTTIFDEIKLLDGTNHDLQIICHVSNQSALIDSKLMQHVLNNLLTNAIKYSPEGSRITLELDRQQDNIIIKVQDEGIGIPSGEQAQIFDPFYRAENVDNRAGTGMGLAIAKEYVKLHGGDISVESTVGEGTTFIVSLPIHA